MIRHDLSHWPLVLTVARGPSSLPQMQRFIDDWAEWLARGEPFATLRVFADAAALEHPAGSGPLAKQWLQQQGEAIRRQVMGMATVVPASDYERLRKMNVEKLFGVPAATFADLPAALDWLHERVYRAHALPFDAPGLRAAADALMTLTP